MGEHADESPRRFDPARHYTEHALEYATAWGSTEPDRALVALRRRLAPGARVLDPACGPGRDLAAGAALGLQMVGSDLAPGALAFAAIRHRAVLRADFCRLPYGDATFDAVWAHAALVHLSLVEVAGALTELARVTRPHGWLHASVKHADDLDEDGFDVARRWFARWEPGAFAAAVAGCGWTVTETALEQDRHRSAVTWVTLAARRH